MLKEILNPFMADLTNNNIFIINLETNVSAYLPIDQKQWYILSAKTSFNQAGFPLNSFFLTYYFCMPLDSAYQILNLSVYCKGHMHAINVIDMGKSTFCHSLFTKFDFHQML